MMHAALLLVWTAAHNGALLSVLLVAVAVLMVMLRRAMRRQRTVHDDENVNVGRALARFATKARYTYFRRPDGETEYDWDDVDEAFPLDWRTGFLKGRIASDMIPAGDEGDEARAAYAGVLDHSTPGVYVRPETDGNGRRVMVRYTHVPMPNGKGACEAVPLSPEIDAAVSDRDRLAADNSRLTRELATLRAHYTQKTEQMRAERVLRGVLGATPADATPAGGGAPS